MRHRPSVIFRGSEALREGALTRARLRGPAVTALFRDVYVDADETITHALRSRGATLVLPADAVITGRSAATVRGCGLARALDPVEVIAPLRRRITWREGIDLRRTAVTWPDSTPWHGGRLATPLRMALDLALDRALPDAVADLDAVLRAGLVDRTELAALVAQRSDRGIVSARRAVGLTDARAESRPESKVRVRLVLAGLRPVPQYWIEDASGHIARTDLAFPEQRPAVEYDGEWRDGQLWALNHDRERLNRVHAAGWDVVFVTQPMLATPKKMIYTVEAALRAASP